MFAFSPRLRALSASPSPAKPPTSSASSHPAWLVVCVSLWLATLCNFPLWRELWALPDINGWRGLGFTLGFMGLIAGAQVAVFGLFTWGRALKPVLVLMVLTATFGAYFMFSYGIVIDSTMLVNVAQTDPGEAGDLLNWRMLVAVVVLALPPLWWLLRRPVRALGWWRQMLHGLLLIAGGLAVAALCLLLVFQDFASTMRNHTKLRYLINPLNSVYALVDLGIKPFKMDMGTLQPLGRDAQLGKSYTQQATPPLLVLVLGETARSMNFALNGYERPTTPLLSARNDISSAPNAWSCGTSTAASVPCMFSHMTRSEFGSRQANYEGLLDVLLHAGLGVVWVDNQAGCKGVCDRLTEISTSKLSDPQWCPGGECQDPIMLRDLDAHIAALPAEQRARGVVVVLHQMGSHGPAYAKRSLPAQKRFTPECQSNALQECSREQLMNAYDNSIVATDLLLNQTIEWLEARASRTQTAMLYVSDHGESLGENNLYLHGLPYAFAPDEQKKVPWITWLSPAMQQRTGIRTACLQQDQATRRLSHDNYFHSVLGLLDVHTSAYLPERDVFAACRGQ
jgi:lipid A ethanolaminephosphotransferase